MGKIGASFEDGIIELDEIVFDQVQTKYLSDEDPTIGRFYVIRESCEIFTLSG